MFVDYKGSTWGIIRWQWRRFLLFVVVATAAVLADAFLPSWVLQMTHLPALPLAVVGGAIGIFVSFRTNAAYDRWWEGRKLWGRLVNTSRHFTTQVLSFLPRGPDGTPSSSQVELVRRQILYVHVLRCVLRKQSPFEDPHASEFFADAEREGLRGQTNITHAILQRHSDQVNEAARAGEIDSFRLLRLDESIMHLLDIQGGCERIKNTPFPRGYQLISERLIIAYGFLLPFGLAHTMGWATVPMTVLVCMAFLLISETGRVLEDPFTLFWPALPLSALSKTIELNLRDRLGEGDLTPELPKPDARGILM